MDNVVSARFGQGDAAVTDGADRHKSTRNAIMRLMSLGNNGHPGVGYAVRELNRPSSRSSPPPATTAPMRPITSSRRWSSAQRVCWTRERQRPTRQPEAGPFSSSQETPQHPQQSWSGPHHLPQQFRNILQEFGTTVHDSGLVGEEQTAKTVYLAITSRLLDKPVSVGMKGHSASGKSYTVKTVTKLLPAGGVRWCSPR